MMRSMYSAVSGLKAHQTRMDVIGNNIANVNTVAFKSQSMTFSEVFYQTTQTASGPNAESGKGVCQRHTQILTVQLFYMIKQTLRPD